MEKHIKSFDLTRNYNRIRDEIKTAMERVLESQCFIMGREVTAFEHEMSEYLDVEDSIGCASGTDALLLALMSLDLEEGDEVITSPFTFFASASCIARTGATPVFADVDPDSYNISPESILEKITPKTKAVIPVHLFGQMARLEEFSHTLKERGITLIEDAAQATGAHRIVDGQICRAGATGDIGCFSFFPTKNLGAYGDGGMVAIKSDAKRAARIKKLRVHGAGTTYIHDEIGINSRLDALQAAILRVKLRHIEEWLEDRRLVAERYMSLFAERGLLDYITPPKEIEGNRHVYHQYVIQAERRDELKAFLDSRGISTRIYYPLSLHEQPCFANAGYRKGDMPVSEMLTKTVLALPMFPELLPEEQEYIVDTMALFYDIH